MANFSGISKDTLIGKLLRIPLRLIPRSTVVPIMQGPLRGMRWTIGSGTHGCWLGSYEHEKQKAFQSKLKAGDVVYDVGANVGFYSLLASVLVGETGHVYSFEPSPDNLRDLRRHLKMNHIRNVTVIDAAVSSVDGESAFDPSGDRCTGRLAKNGSFHVRTVTLDRLIFEDGIRPPTLMKIDIEGAENECLRGAFGVIQKFQPLIFLATHGPDIHIACSEILKRCNYRLTSLDVGPPERTDELIAFPEQSM